MCSSDCPWIYVADGQCDRACFNSNCQMDGGDCDENNKSPRREYSSALEEAEEFEEDFDINVIKRRVLSVDLVNETKELSTNLDAKTRLKNHMKKSRLNITNESRSNTKDSNIHIMQDTPLNQSNLLTLNSLSYSSRSLLGLPSSKNSDFEILKRVFSLKKASLLYNEHYKDKKNAKIKAFEELKHLGESSRVEKLVESHNKQVLMLDKIKRKSRLRTRRTVPVHAMKQTYRAKEKLSEGGNGIPDVNRIISNVNETIVDVNKIIREGNKTSFNKTFSNKTLFKKTLSNKSFSNKTLFNRNDFSTNKKTDDINTIYLKQKDFKKHMNTTKKTVPIELDRLNQNKLHKTNQNEKPNKKNSNKNTNDNPNILYIPLNKPPKLSYRKFDTETLLKKFRRMKKIPYMKKETFKGNTTHISEAYGLSLQHSTRVYNTKYGFNPRYVPAHSAILIDRDIMEELQRTFPDEFLRMSRNKFRSEDDMQYSFSYYYFIIEEEVKLSVGEVFDMFDTDKSG